MGLERSQCVTLAILKNLMANGITLACCKYCIRNPQQYSHSGTSGHLGWASFGCCHRMVGAGITLDHSQKIGHALLWLGSSFEARREPTSSCSQVAEFTLRTKQKQDAAFSTLWRILKTQCKFGTDDFHQRLITSRYVPNRIITFYLNSEDCTILQQHLISSMSRKFGFGLGWTNVYFTLDFDKWAYQVKI